MEHTQVILITGASRGIGAGFARYFAQQGHAVIINYRSSPQEAEALTAELASSSSKERLLCVKADVASRQDVRAMFDAAIERFDNVDVLINNAGQNIDRPFLAMTDDEWQRVIDTNLTGTFICSQEFALRCEDRAGQIINIGATTGLRGRKNGANYCSAKAGVITLTKCLALELAPKIVVNCVIPGFIDTEEVAARYNLHDPEKRQHIINTIPMQQIGTIEDICRMVDFLINQATYITGQNFFVNGGNFMH